MGCGEKQTGKTAMHPEPVVVAVESDDLDAQIERAKAAAAKAEAAAALAWEFFKEAEDDVFQTKEAVERLRKILHRKDDEWCEARRILRDLQLRSLEQ
jgi:chromosome segregation ATPase